MPNFTFTRRKSYAHYPKLYFVFILVAFCCTSFGQTDNSSSLTSSKTAAAVETNSVTTAGITVVIKGITSKTLPSRSTILYGNSSIASTGASINSYAWSFISGPSQYTMVGTSTSTLNINGLVAGNYIFRLTVKDTKGASAYKNVTVAVKGIADVSPAAPSNIAPVAIITGNRSIMFPATTAFLYGSGTDADGTIKSYAWKYISGPSSYTFTGENTNAVRIYNLNAGTYVFQLTVTDDKGGVGSVNATVTMAIPVDNSPEAVSCGCTKVIPANTGNNINISGPTMGAVPGDVLCIKSGKYNLLNLSDFHGTADKPIIIKNCGGPVTISGYTGYGILISQSSFFHLTGTGSTDKYGISVKSTGPGVYMGNGFTAGNQSTDFEVDHIETNWTGVGIWVKTQPSCDPMTWRQNFTMRNVSLHDLYVHNTVGEGFYVGHTKDSVNVTCNGSTFAVGTQRIEGLKIYNCITDSTGYDGIQVTTVPKGSLVYNNRVTNFGTQNTPTQQFGIIMGGSSSGSVYNNYVANGSGAGMEIFGQGNMYIYNNVIVNVGKDNTAVGQDGIYVDNRTAPGDLPLVVLIANNTIVNPKRDGIRVQNGNHTMGTGNGFYNNLVVNPGTYGMYKLYNSTVYPNSSGSYPKGDPLVFSAVNVVDHALNFVASNNLVSTNIADFKFANISTNNFALTTGSPAINTGKDLSSYNIITTDFLYAARPQGGAYDVGAYEFAQTTASLRSVANNKPTVVLDKSLAVDEASSGIVLDGSKSFAQPGSQIVKYEWRPLNVFTNVRGLAYTDKSKAVLANAEPGTYTFELVATDNNDLKDSARITLVVSKKLNAGLVIAPVPAKEVLNVYLNDEAKGKVALRVFDGSGKTIILNNNMVKDAYSFQHHLDVNSLTPGIYYFEAVVGAKRFTSKFVKIN